MSSLVVAAMAIAAGVACMRVRGAGGEVLPGWKRLGIGCFGLILGALFTLPVGRLWSPNTHLPLAMGFLSLMLMSVAAAIAVIRHRVIDPGSRLDGLMIGVVTFTGALELLIRPLLTVEYDSSASLIPLAGQFCRAGAILLVAVGLVWYPRRVDRLLFSAILMNLLSPALVIAIAGRTTGSVPAATSWQNGSGWAIGFVAVIVCARRAARPNAEPVVPAAISRATSLRRLTTVSIAAVTIETAVAVQASMQPGFSWIVVVSIIAFSTLVALRFRAEARLSEQVVERTRERDRLHAVVDLSTAIVNAESVEQLLRDVGEATARALACPCAEVSLFSPEGIETRVTIGECDGQDGITVLQPGVTAIRNLQDRMTTDVPFVADPSDARLPQALRERWAGRDLQNILIAPMTTGGAMFGFVAVWEPGEARGFSADDIATATAVVQEGSLAVRGARLLDFTRRRSDERALLLRVSNAASSSLDLSTVLSEIANASLRLAGIERSWIELWDSRTNELVVTAYATIPEWPCVDPTGARYGVTPHGELRNLLVGRAPVRYSPVSGGIPEELHMVGAVDQAGAVVVIPLWAGEERVGLLKCSSRDPNAFGLHDASIVQDIGAQTALAVHNARLLEAARVQADERDVLLRVAKAATSSLDLYVVMGEIAASTIGVAGIESAAIELWHRDTGELEIAAQDTIAEWPGVDEPGTRYPVGYWNRDEELLASRQPICLNLGDADLDESSRDRMITAGTGSILIIPLWIGDQCLGLIDFFSRSSYAFSDATVRLGTEIASQTALAIHNARLLAVEQQRSNEWAILHRAGRAASSSLDVRTVLAEIAQASLDIPGVEACSITLWDPKTRHFVLQADVAVPSWNCVDEIGTRYTEYESVFGYRALTSRTAFIVDGGDPELSEASQRLHRATGIAGDVVIPILRHDEAIGVYYLVTRRPGVFDEDTLRIGREIASHAAHAILNARQLDAERKRGNEWAILHQVSRAAVSSLDKQTVLNEVARACLGIDGTEGCTIFSLDLANEEMIVEADIGIPGRPGVVDPGTRFPLLPGAAEFRAIGSRQPIIVEADDTTLIQSDRDIMATYGMKSIVIIPSRFSDEDTGIVYLVSSQARAFNESAIRLGAEIGAQVALAFNNSRLLDAERQRVQERSALLRVSQAATSSLDLRTVLAEIAQATLGVAGIESCDILLWHADSDEFEVGADVSIPGWPGVETPGTRFPIGDRSFDRRLLTSNKPILISASDPNLLDCDRAEFSLYGAGCTALFPLWVGSHPVGILEAYARDAGAFDEVTLRIGAEFAVQTALAIQNALLLHESQRYAMEQSALLSVSRAVSAGIELGDIMQEVARASLAIAGADCCEIELLHPGEEETEVIAVQSSPRWNRDSTPTGKRLKFRDWPITKLVIESREPISIDDESPLLTDRERQMLFAGRHSSALFVPMLLDDRCFGIVCCYAGARQAFSKDSIRLGLDLASQAAIAIERKRLSDALELQANTDGLTGLLNHRAIQERLDAEISRAHRSDASFAVLMIDLNRFKHVNDTLGHTTGDWLLKRAAESLKSSTRAYDAVGRYGGDEFLVILPDTDMLEAIEVADRIAASAANAADGGTVENLPISLSIGIAVFPIHAATRQELIEAADRAMYEAKRRRGHHAIAAPAVVPAIAG